MQTAQQTLKKDSNLRLLRSSLKWGGALAGLYLVIALFLLPEYGSTWDTAVGEFPYGKQLAEKMESVGLQNVQFFPLTFGIATLYVGTKRINHSDH